MTVTKNIVILGGGTSAWLTAAYLSKKLPKGYFNLTIVEGKSNKSIGVGESTLPNFPQFMEDCGFEVKEWFDFCECTHKVGVGFKDWDYIGSRYWHPFGFMPIFKDGSNLFDLINHLSIPKNTISRYFQDFQTSIIQNQNPNHLKGVHINAGKLKEFLQQNVNIKVIREDIIDIKYINNIITNLTLSSNATLTSDLFIDCLGFNSILKEKNPSYKYQPKQESTPVNASIFNPVRYSSPNAKLTPYTDAHCTPHGWIWKTPLQSRLGAGMVFNKEITSKEEAINWYENYWGKEHLINPQTKYIEFTPGYYTNQWNGNVISIGLSTGFVEPLEATGIQIILEGIINSFESFCKGYFSQEDVDLFNIRMNNNYSSTFDFINIHYLNTTHNTPFWNYVNKNYSIPKSKTLKFKLDHVKNIPYDPNYFEPNQLFDSYSWYYTIAQFTNIFPKTKKIFLKNPQLELEIYLKETN
jgi:hypothetical protein